MKLIEAFHMHRYALETGIAYVGNGGTYSGMPGWSEFYRPLRSFQVASGIKQKIANGTYDEPITSRLLEHIVNGEIDGILLEKFGDDLEPVKYLRQHMQRNGKTFIY
jgi:hypothetical protein